MKAGSKRKRILIVTTVVTVILVVVLLTAGRNPHAPRFTPMDTAPAPAAFSQLSYSFPDTRPFKWGRTWIRHVESGTTNFKHALYDIEERAVLGELTNALPLTMVEQSKVLCVLPAAAGVKERLRKLVAGVAGGRFKFVNPSPTIHSYWILDLERNAAMRIGDIPQGPHFTFEPSPDLRYGYTAFQGAYLLPELYCIDIRRRHITRLNAPWWPSGWWDRSNLLVLTTNRDFVLHDVESGKTSQLVKSERIVSFFRESMLPDDPAKAQLFQVWNGRENDFYLTDRHKRWLAAESYLIKLERPGGDLNLLARRFKFEPCDHLHPTGRYYLYGGGESESHGVSVRDLQTGTITSLTTETGGGNSNLARFYGDSVLYIENDALWKVDLDGTGRIQLFPPP